MSDKGDPPVKAADEEKAGDDEMKDFPMRELSFKIPLIGTLRFNPLVSMIGIVLLWGLAGYCIGAPDHASDTLGSWFSDVQQYFTWFYIAANPVLCAFVIFIAVRFGDVKLGKGDEEPEFSDSTYFAMIFSAGVGVGLFFYGVSEPLSHQASNYFSNTGFHSQDEIDQWALTIVMYHWGFSAWSCYLVVALAVGLATYRFGLPMTIRSTFYPLLGDYTWGWIGDWIDGFSIVMTVAGVCTSLGLGTIQIVSGLQRLGWVDPEREGDDLKSAQVWTIWIITLFATISVISGLSLGIKILSNIAFYLGCLILFLCFTMEKTYYLLNLIVQTAGTYMQWNIFQMPFWTDAFGALKSGEGRSVDGKSGADWWIGGWSVFYMAWWVAWACFVGTFIARISKNRSLRTIIISTFLAPTLYSLLWFGIMGGIGLRQQRQSLELQALGEEYFGDSEFYSDGSNACYDVPQEDVVVNGTVVFTNTLPGVTPVCGADGTNSWFNVMFSFSYPGSGLGGDFGGFGRFLSGFSLFALAIYFITSSDSGSLVVDILASNGAKEHNWLQRVFWAVTEGGVATALLVAGGSRALSALQAVSIVFGLPFNFFLFIMCHTIYRMCKVCEEHKDNTHSELLLREKDWSMPIYGGIFNIFEFIFSFGCVHEDRTSKHMHLPTGTQAFEFFKGLLLPFLPLYSIYSALDSKGEKKTHNMALTFIYTASFVGWVIFFCFGVYNFGFVAFGWTLFFNNAIILTNLRAQVRDRAGIKGNVISDFCMTGFFYPQALAQMQLELDGLDESPHSD
jgi:choline-glycine betaine transporter